MSDLVPGVVAAEVEREAEAARIEMLYRRELWLNHGHAGLYGDDGEMQCGTCPCDYKRQPLAEVEARVLVARLERAARGVTEYTQLKRVQASLAAMTRTAEGYRRRWDMAHRALRRATLPLTSEVERTAIQYAYNMELRAVEMEFLEPLALPPEAV